MHGLHKEEIEAPLAAASLNGPSFNELHATYDVPKLSAEVQDSRQFLKLIEPLSS
jgi:hypothetical protein